MSIMVFVPLTVSQAHTLHDQGRLQPAYATAATAELYQAFGYDAKTAEDADYAAQLFAGLRCVADGHDRLIVSAELSTKLSAGPDAELGQVNLSELNWADVTAIFTDDPADLDKVRQLTQPWAGQDVAALWERDEVAKFVEDYSLLWFDPTEFDLALAPLESAAK